MDHIKFKVNTTGHVYTLGESIHEAKHIWFVFHGYGQLASNIIRKFEGIDLKQHFVISVEGLSRFYWGGVTGEVAASWMTKSDRLDEIDDYLRFIDQVYEHFKIEERDSNFHCLAFSQGTSTSWRWLAHRKPVLKTFIQWAGMCPPELDYNGVLAPYVKTFDHHYIYGDQDEYLTPERLIKMKDFFSQNLLTPKITTYEGEHKIYRDVLEKLIEKMT